MKNLIISVNITILEDEAITIDDKVVLVGRKDSSLIGNQGENRSDISDKLEEISDCLPIVVLDHQPSNIDEYKHADLILSGHTHQEQEHGRAVILKNNVPRYLVIDFSKVYNDIVASSEDVLNISKRLIEKNRKSVFIVPYLFLLGGLLKAKEVFSVGAVMAVVSIVFLWIIIAVFKCIERKLAALGTTFLSAIPLMIIVNVILSKMIEEPVLDVWDVLSVFMLLILAFVSFICDYAKKKGLMK